MFFVCLTYTEVTVFGLNSASNHLVTGLLHIIWDRLGIYPSVLLTFDATKCELC